MPNNLKLQGSQKDQRQDSQLHCISLQKLHKKLLKHITSDTQDTGHRDATQELLAVTIIIFMWIMPLSMEFEPKICSLNLNLKSYARVSITVINWSQLVLFILLLHWTLDMFWKTQSSSASHMLNLNQFWLVWIVHLIFLGLIHHHFMLKMVSVKTKWPFYNVYEVYCQITYDMVVHPY